MIRNCGHNDRLSVEYSVECDDSRDFNIVSTKHRLPFRPDTTSHLQVIARSGKAAKSLKIVVNGSPRGLKGRIWVEQCYGGRREREVVSSVIF